MVRRDPLPPPLRQRFPLCRLAAALLLLAPAGVAVAQTRYARRFGVDHGLDPSYVVSLAQDPDGLLWIGTSGGLYRYDGVEMRRWAPGTLLSWVSVIELTPDGALVVLEEDHGGVFTVTAQGARPVPGPDGRPLDGVHHLAVDVTGTLWALRGDEVLSRDAAGRWTGRQRDALDGTRLQRVYEAAAGGAYVLSSAAVWFLASGAAPRLVVEVAQPRRALELPDGRLLVVSFDGVVVEARGDRSTVLLRMGTRGIDIAERGGTYWVSFDRYLAALTPGLEPEVLGADDGLASGGPLLVDHEGSLWLGTAAGLLQFPEPNTRIWSERHGLPTAHTRFLARTGDTMWVSTWRGVGAIARSRGRWRAWTVPAWSWVRRVFAEEDGARHGGAPGTPPLHAFVTRADGSEWFGTGAGLLVAPSHGAAPRSARGLPFGSDLAPVNAVLHDRAGRTWLASERRVCRAPDVNPLDLAAAGWTCDEIRSGHHASALVERPDGAVWASFVRGGVWRLRDGAWELLERDGAPLAYDVLGLVPSPSGGVWAVGSYAARRLAEDSTEPGGVRVVEVLSSWHGLRDVGIEDVVEERDGTVWLATGVGVARVPSSARRPAGPPRRVVLVDASVDEERVPLEDELALPHHRNRLTLRFAAPSYRDPGRLRYQVRLSAWEPWTAVTGPPVFRWVNLRPGRYQAEVRASLDGQAWTPEPAGFAFRVMPPWYLTPWALTLLVLGVAAALSGAYRARVAALLRLERQRTRIAMDLHDEMGSGLGSIGILSGVLAGDHGDGPHRGRLAGQISEIAQELGTALSDIVWSLDPRSSTLEDVAGRLAEHGSRLFADDSVRFAVQFPDAWPGTPLDFPLRRGLLLIGLEALHNAARHARARAVTLSVRPADRGWRLVVEDDGTGLPDAARRGDAGGVGLRNLRRRAGEIGARIAWSERPGGGTRVTLDFPLTAWPAGGARR